ncbi:573_t:CDS:2 [Entrophospora sp. SA101]|nr:573_t:CDS:2 [Entrophospora sp. SA101]
MELNLNTKKNLKKIFFNSTNVYKNTHERTKLTKKEKDNVFKMIKIKLGWAYFNQIDGKTSTIQISSENYNILLAFQNSIRTTTNIPPFSKPNKKSFKQLFQHQTNKLPDSYIKELRNVREKLRVEYFFSGKLPDTYFNFPKPRELLPFSPKGLPNYLAQYLPFNSNRTEKTLREIVQELREYYIFKKLPNNYFTPKPRLPNSPDNTIFNYIFPITEQNTAKEFIKEARRKYEIIFPINKKWINVPKTNTKNKPFLPKNINELDAQFIVDEEIILPITNKTNIRNIVIKLGKKYFFERIPDEWISIEKTNDNIDTPALEISNIERKQLPDLTTTTQELDKYNIKITIPIIDDKKIHQTTQTLKKLYIFKYLPDAFINLPPIPNPDKTPPSKKNNNKSNLIEFLIDNNYIDTQKYAFDKHTEHTWQRNASSSRIDFIWVDNNIFDKITKINKPYIPNYKTDHKCLSIDLNIKLKIGRQHQT